MLAALASVVGVPVALAQQATPTSGNESVTISGVAQVRNTRDGQQLLLNGDAASGATSWHFQSLLTPTSVGGDGTLQLQGNFTLSGGDTPASGQATGTLTQHGQATLSLTDPSTNTQLQTSFQFQTGGAFTFNLAGQYPTAAAATAATAAGTGTHTFWYLSRTAGLTAYGLLFLNVCLGLLVQTGWVDKVFPRWRSFDLHQFTALMAVGVLGVHVFSLLGDQYFNFSLPQLLVPFASPYRSLWVGLGVIAFYTTILVTASFYVRRRIGQKTWRALHYVTFGIFFVALVHGLFAGTDSVTTWARLTYFATGGIVLILTLRRIGDRSQTKGRPNVVLQRQFARRSGKNGRPQRLGPTRSPLGQQPRR